MMDEDGLSIDICDYLEYRYDLKKRVLEDVKFSNWLNERAEEMAESLFDQMNDLDIDAYEEKE